MNPPGSPAAWLIVTYPDDTERQHRWPRALAFPRAGEAIRLDHGTEAEELLVINIHHLLNLATGSHMPIINAIPDPEETPMTDQPQHADPLLRWFDYQHLPADLQEVSLHFAVLAVRLATELPRCAERSAALRSLLVAKDAAVRAAIEGREAADQVRPDDR